MKETVKNFKNLWPFLKEHKFRLFIILFLNLLNIIISVIVPIINAQMIIKLTSNLMEQLLWLVLCYSGLGVLECIFYYINNIFYNKTYLEMQLKLQHRLAEEVLKLDNKSLDNNGSGIFTNRLMQDTENMSIVFENVTSYLREILSSVGVFVSVFLINKIVFFYIVFVVFIRFTIESIRLKIRKKRQKEIKEIRDSVSTFSSEMIRGSRDIKMLNSESSFLNTFNTKFNNLNEKRVSAARINLTLQCVRWLWGEFSAFGLYIILMLLIMFNKLEIAFALVIVNYNSRWNMFASNIVFLLDVLNNFNLSATRVFELFGNEKYSKETFGDVHLRKVNGDFEFNNVSFSYNDKKVLDNLSFNVNANETVAFVGRSGVGKTTIFNLLCKMYDNYDGLITIDGVDIKKLDKDSIRGNITIVSQDPYIFNVSIKDNLKLVCKNMTTKQMKEACRMACLDKFIESLPDKYDTIVGEGGVTLSGGQKQRLAIARAFLQKTEIILFDEATSALDNETQSEIAKAINNLKKDYTILIVAHRLSTIKNADRILFIEDGKVQKEGSHEYLLKNCKSYKELYEAEIEK